MSPSDIDALPFEVEPAMERKCGRCRTVRPIAMFYTDLEERRALKDGRSRFRMNCRVCQREINDARRRERQDIADAIKLAAGCADCAIRSTHPEIYDFDHRPDETKVAAVSTLLTKGTLEDFLAEIAKCDVVCANCHRIRTRARPANSFGQTRSPR